MEDILSNYYSQARILELVDSKGTEWLREHALALSQGLVTVEEAVVEDDHTNFFHLGGLYMEKSFNITLTYEGSEPSQKDILLSLMSGYATLSEITDDPSRYIIETSVSAFKVDDIDACPVFIPTIGMLVDVPYPKEYFWRFHTPSGLNTPLED